MNFHLSLHLSVKNYLTSNAIYKLFLLFTYFTFNHKLIFSELYLSCSVLFNLFFYSFLLFCFFFSINQTLINWFILILYVIYYFSLSSFRLCYTYFGFQQFKYLIFQPWLIFVYSPWCLVCV